MIIRVLLLSILCGAGLTDQERITLTVAETKPSNSEYRVELFDSLSDNPATSPLDEGYLVIRLKGQNDEIVNCTYNAGTNPTGTFLNTALNKANLSTAYAGNATTGSLKQRIYHRLFCGGAGLCESTAVCGKTLTGTITGAVP